MPTELTFGAFHISKRIKRLLKREVNNETFFISLRLYYHIYYYTLVDAVYILYFVKDVDTARNMNIYKYLYVYKVGMPPSHPWNE